MATRFISTVYLKANTTIEDNVDDDKLVPYIQKSQDIHIQQILGSDFYFHLQDAAENNTLTTAEENLLRVYLQPALAEWSLYEAMPFISNKLTNKSVSQESSEFSQPSGLDELKYIRKSVRDMAEFYGQRLVKELCKNTNLYPVYNESSDENVNKKRRSYFSGVYLGKKQNENIRKYDDPSNDCDC